MPICIDCNGERELDTHGNCATCGSHSIIYAFHPQILITAARELVEKIGGEPKNALERARLTFIDVQFAQSRGCTLGQHLENTIEMWRLVSDMMEAIRGNPKTDN